MFDNPHPAPSDIPPSGVYFRRPSPPVATLAILAVCGVMYTLTVLAGGATNPDVLLSFGASYGPYIRGGEYWRLVMPMFLHVGILHLLINGYALYLLGRLLERVYGYALFTLIYVGCGIGSAALSMTLSNNESAGASGAIFGIAGVMLVAGYLRREAVPPHWGRAFGKGMIPFIVLNLALGFSIKRFFPIDNWAHVGGLVTGIVLALLIPPPPTESLTGALREQPFQALLLIPLIVVTLAMAAAGQDYRSARLETQLLLEGERLRAARQNALALQRFQEAARRAPNDERPHEELGSLYLQQNQAADAVREYEQALRITPGSTRAQLGLGLAYRQKGDLAQAHELFEKALGKNPTTAVGQEALADLCAEQKLYAEAVEHYEQTLRIEPNLAEAHNNLAWLYATSDDPNFRKPQEALEHARRAVELSRWKEPNFIDTLAEAFYANRNFSEAVKAETKALELDPQNREFEDHMARYRKAAGV